MPSQQLATIRFMSESGVQRMSADSMSGTLDRPRAEGFLGSRIAGFETLFNFFINNVPDPDTALAQDPHFDSKLRQQPDVHACMTLRELTVASMPVKFEPSNRTGIDRALAKKISDYCNDVFDMLPNRADLYRQMQNAVLMGGQGHEWVWARDATGIEYPATFYPMDKSRFIFDRLGNMALLTRETPVWGTYVQQAPVHIKGHNVFPALAGKFMYHRYKAQGGPWSRPVEEGYVYWGRGEDTNLFIPVVFDQFVLRFRMKWLEKHGMPLTLMYYPDNAVNVSEIKAIAKSIREEGIVTIPRKIGPDGKNYFYDIEFVEPPSMGYDAFAQFSDTYTKPRIEKILLGGANLLELGEHGAYAASVNQRDAGAEIIFRYDAQNIDTTIDLQLVPFMVWARWPGIPHQYFPRHKMTPEIQKDRLAELEVLEKMSGSVPTRQDDWYDVGGFKKPKGEEAVVFLGSQPGADMDPSQAFPGGPGPLQTSQLTTSKAGSNGNVPSPSGVKSQPGGRPSSSSGGPTPIGSKHQPPRFEAYKRFVAHSQAQEAATERAQAATVATLHRIKPSLRARV